MKGSDLNLACSYLAILGFRATLPFQSLGSVRYLNVFQKASLIKIFSYRHKYTNEKTYFPLIPSMRSFVL